MFPLIGSLTMTALSVDNLFFEIDALVEALEDGGYELADIIDAMGEYVEVVSEYL